MSKKNGTKGGIITGALAAFAASSCCIIPLIAGIAGVGGASSSLSWIEPLRPYLIGFAVIAIGYAWYSHFQPKKEDDCGCDVEKQKWYQTKGFLVGMTLFATLSISFPYYADFFYSENKKEVVVVDSNNVRTKIIQIEGMTCEACENHVNSAVNELHGIIEINTSYSNGSTTIKFDDTKTNVDEIEKAVGSTGYKVIKKEKE